MQKHYVTATAGHVDHGKSALVKALTGIDPDRLPEEKAREITIDLGYAHLELSRPNQTDPESSDTFSISIVDVPGHEDFVRNMIAGVGSIDLALLVVAADDGWMPQTEEHLQILTYLGVKRMVVAVNKCDFVRPNRAIAQIQDQLRATPFESAPIIPVSARSGSGLEELKEQVARIIADSETQRDIGKPRLFIDRAFNLTGIGPVVTGTLTGGTLVSGQSVFLQPGNFKTRARSLQSHNAPLTIAVPGMRTGLNLADLPRTGSHQDLRRGYILTSGMFESTTTLDVLIERSPRLGTSTAAARPLKRATSVHLQYGTGRFSATLVLADKEALSPGETAIAQLRLASPIVAFVGDRFVLRDRSEQHTIGGGIVLDYRDTARSFRSLSQQKLLRTRAQHSHSAAVWVESELIGYAPAKTSNLLVNSNFSESDIRQALSELHTAGSIVMAGNVVSDVNSWRLLRERATQAIDRVHRTRPEQRGVDLAELRGELPGATPEVVDALVTDLCRDGFVRHGSALGRLSHRPALPETLDRSAKRILAALMEKPLDPPARNRLAPDSDHQQAVRYLIEHGDIVDLGTDLLLSGEAFALAKQRVVRFIASNGSGSVSELREALETSRRVAVPLLERLDRERVTRRLGDRRVLVEAKADRKT